MGQKVRAHMQAMVEGDVNSFYPEVLISYATGQRDSDAKGCGPGMYYAKAVADKLADQHVRTFSGLHVGTGVNWRVLSW